MRTKLNSKQRQRLREQREHNAEIKEALENEKNCLNVKFIIHNYKT